MSKTIIQWLFLMLTFKWSLLSSMWCVPYWGREVQIVSEKGHVLTYIIENQTRKAKFPRKPWCNCELPEHLGGNTLTLKGDREASRRNLKKGLGKLSILSNSSISKKWKKKSGFTIESSLIGNRKSFSSVVLIQLSKQKPYIPWVWNCSQETTKRQTKA